MAKRKRRAPGKSKTGPHKGKSRFLFLIIAFPFRIIWKLCVLIGSGVQRILSYSRARLNEHRIESKRATLGKLTGYEPISIIETEKGDYRKFEERLLNNKSTIGIILGARGSGKSGLGMRLLENIHSKSKRRCFCMGFRQETLPTWLRAVETVDEAGKDAVLLIDEGGILYSARKSMSSANKILSDALLIARHNDLSIIFISQNSANLEINTLRQADYLLLKPSSLLQKDFEREKIRSVYEAAASRFEKHSSNEGLLYIYSQEFIGFGTNTLPSFWSSRVSKSFRK